MLTENGPVSSTHRPRGPRPRGLRASVRDATEHHGRAVKAEGRSRPEPAGRGGRGARHPDRGKKCDLGSRWLPSVSPSETASPGEDGSEGGRDRPDEATREEPYHAGIDPKAHGEALHR